MPKLTIPFPRRVKRPTHWLAPEIAHFAVVDDRRKRDFFALILLILIPILLFFTALNLYSTGFNLEVILEVGAIGIAAGILWLMRSQRTLQSAYRLGIAYTLTMTGFLLATGGSDGLSYLWFYFYPPVVYFLVGHNEGNYWIALSWLVGLGVTVFDLGPSSYPVAIGIRFIISYSLVCVLAYGLELSRHHYYSELLAEKLALEAALQQVNTLQGLLPICASCKKVRDDSGYWHQVESYMRRHAGVEFSHSICPECRTTLYPPRTRKPDQVTQME